MIEKISRDLNNSKRVVAFTGAGISAESGIPTYRGKGGFWTKYDPDKYASIDYFEKDPSYYWSFFKESRKPILENAKPNPAHYSLAELEKREKLRCVITQNIDGMHQQAGSKNVIELHGTTRNFRCKRCEKFYTLEEIGELLKVELPPLCKECKGIIRPNVIFFGEMLPQDALRRAISEAENCDFMMAIGSSLVVYPAAQIPLIAKDKGAILLIINVEPTGLDLSADYVINEKAGKVLPEIVEHLNSIS
ncbi:NAD-dependent protein deacylase [candidate division KSB1 bacterium]|nr:MAG: NAD-dependent protein deacylase [candidate division KSB1 bacterium]